MFALACAVRALHLWQMRDELIYQVLISDPWKYDAWAREIVAGDWLGREVFYQTPLYPYLLAVIYTIFGHSIWAVRIVQLLFGATACVFLARAGARFFSERIGACAGVLLALYPPAIFFDGILQKASVDLLFMTGLLWLLAAAQARPSWPRMIAAGALLGAMTLNRENAAALFPVVLLWVAWLSWPRRYRATAGYVAAYLAGAALVLVPVGARNAYVGGMFALTTSQMGTNFYIGNRAGANGTYESLRPGRGDPRYESLDARLLAEEDWGRKLSPSEISRYWMARSWRDVQAAPRRWLALLARKWQLTWNARELIDSESLSTHARYSMVLAVVGPVWQFGALAALAVPGLWWTRSQWRSLWILYAILFAMAAAVTVFYVFARYRYPLVPPLALFAAAGLLGLVERVRRPAYWTSPDALAGLALLIAALIFCHQRVAVAAPGLALDDDAITFFNAGTQHGLEGRTAEAIALWKAALDEDPRLPEAYHHLGRAELAAGHFDAARDYFERGRQLDPTQPMFPVNLGIVAAELEDEAGAESLIAAGLKLSPLALASLPELARDASQRGQYAAAIVLWRAVIRHNPASAGSYVALGEALQAAGRWAEALDALRTAVRLDPKLLNVINNLAWILATSPDAALRKGPEAVALAEAACRATDYTSPALLDTLAAAYAETGQYDRAAATCEQALAATTDESLKRLLMDHLAQYRAGHPYRDPASVPPPAVSP